MTLSAGGRLEVLRDVLGKASAFVCDDLDLAPREAADLGLDGRLPCGRGRGLEPSTSVSEVGPAGRRVRPVSGPG
jgi:hypothetical protein